MTENPNIQPDPNAGQPPGGPVGQPSTPVEPESAGAAKPAGAPESPKTEPTPQSAVRPGEAAAASAAEPGSERGSEPGPEPASEPPGTQNPATGNFAANPWATPEEEPEFAEPAGPNAPSIGVAATFLPGVDAASILALVVAALAAGAFLLVNPLVQAHDAARTWSDFKNNVPRTRQDPFGMQRDWVDYQSWTHIILGLVAVLLALTVLALWTAQRNKLRSRSFAQAALVLGLAVVLYGILLKTGAVGHR